MLQTAAKQGRDGRKGNERLGKDGTFGAAVEEHSTILSSMSSMGF